MSDHFDLILAEDWCESTHSEISYKTHKVSCHDTAGRCHKLLTQAPLRNTLCPIVSVIHLDKSLQHDDILYLVNVTDGHEHANTGHVDSASTDAKLSSLLDKYKVCFPADLPA